MKKLMAASVGLLLGVVTAANAQDWSRDRDPAEQLDVEEQLDADDELDPDEKRESTRSASTARSGGATRGNDTLARTAKPDPESAMFGEVEILDNNQRGAAESSGGDARSQAQQYGNRQRQAGAYQGQAGRGDYQARASGSAGGGSSQFDNSQREGSGFRGDLRDYDDGSLRDGNGNDGGESNRYSARSDSRYRDGNDSRYSGRYDNRYRSDKRLDGVYPGYRPGYDSRYGGGYDQRYRTYRGGYASGYGNLGSYDRYLGFRGKWNNQSYQSPWRYSYPSGYGARSWSQGLYLPSAYYAPTYYIDPAPYGLQPPPYGYAWVRVDADVLLVEVRSGLIVDVLRGFFY